MNKEQAYEKLELPVGTNLQVVQQQFNKMHNDFRVQIDGAFNEEIRRRKQQQFAELEEAFKLLMDSDSTDISRSTPYTGKTFDHVQGHPETQAPSEQWQAPPPPQKESNQEQKAQVTTPSPAKSVTAAPSRPARKKVDSLVYIILGLIAIAVAIYLDTVMNPGWRSKYDDVESFSGSFAAVKLNGKHGFVNKKGEEVIPLQYDNAGSFKEGLAAVERNGKHGFIDTTGKEMIPLIYDDANWFKEGFAAVERNGKYGFIDTTGNEVIALQYDRAWNFSEGLAEVKRKEKWGFIDKTGKEVIPFKYDNTHSFSEDLAGVCLNGECGFIDKTGKEVIPLKYFGVNSFKKGITKVGLDGEIFYIDKQGEWVKACPDCHL